MSHWLVINDVTMADDTNIAYYVNYFRHLIKQDTWKYLEENVFNLILKMNRHEYRV